MGRTAEQLDAEIACLRSDYNDCCATIAEQEAEIAQLRAALESIAKNICCDRCQEAALVARAALEQEA